MRPIVEFRFRALVAVVATASACASKPPERADQASHGPAAGALIASVEASPAGPAPAGMVWIPGGTFSMGCERCGMPDALPVHRVTVSGFWIDETPVTNAQFLRFVEATGYLTVAERRPDPKAFPGVPPAELRPGSLVFSPPAWPVALDDLSRWWRYVSGASWKQPEGPRSTLQGREEHPVVHVAWEDALAYLKWAGKRLPTEAEYEYAARGGLEGALYAWGNDLKPGGKWASNVWQGRFPDENRSEDGFVGTAPVRAFPPNGFGLYDMGGNVWQWCSDWYRPDYYAVLAASTSPARNPGGPDASYDPQEPGAAKRVVRGGSFLCSESYCTRYLVGSRGKAEISTGASNLGFRAVR
jgi:formylglycine-generating enzyme